MTHLHQEINDCKNESELSQTPSNQSIAILREKLEQKVTSYEKMLEKGLIQMKIIQ
jgi:hypothetical protein